MTCWNDELDASDRDAAMAGFAPESIDADSFRTSSGLMSFRSLLPRSHALATSATLGTEFRRTNDRSMPQSTGAICSSC